MDSVQTTVELGAEWDGKLVERLRQAVIYSGGYMMLSSHDLGGSEELISYTIVLPEGELEAVAESHMGLRLSGPQTLVHKLAQAARQA
ncbi:MAG TPA: hypothetical protein VEC06_09530 [Paucimonas sp.]|nr:hypothetical protein [Paucimonas sp.]